MTRLVCFRLNPQDMSLQFFVVIKADLRLEKCNFFGSDLVEAGVRCRDRFGMQSEVSQ